MLNEIPNEDQHWAAVLRAYDDRYFGWEDDSDPEPVTGYLYITESEEDAFEEEHGFPFVDQSEEALLQLVFERTGIEAESATFWPGLGRIDYKYSDD